MPTLWCQIFYTLPYHTRGGHMTKNTGARSLAGPHCLAKSRLAQHMMANIDPLITPGN